MRLIIGGAYQGKAKYAEEKYGVRAADYTEDISVAKCVKDFHLYIKCVIEHGRNPMDAVQKLIRENPDIIIIMDEIGCGIIPLEKSERLWRETVGNVGCFLAERAESVERIICGTAVRIK